MTSWPINSQKAATITDHSASTGKQAGVSEEIAALLGCNGQDFQPISEIHYLLYVQERKRAEVLTNEKLSSANLKEAQSWFIDWTDKMKVKSQSCCPTLYHPMDYTVQNRILERVAVPFSRGIFTTQGLNPDFPHCRQVLYCLSHQDSPIILQWVACPVSRVSS